MLGEHGGNIYEVAHYHGCSLHKIIDMSNNISPSGFPPGLLRHLKDNITKKLYPSTTPFSLAHLPNKVSAENAWDILADDRILIRNCSNISGLSNQFIRISSKIPGAIRILAGKLLALVVSSADLNFTPKIKRTAGL